MRLGLRDHLDARPARGGGRLRPDADRREVDAEPRERPRGGGRGEHDEVALRELGRHELARAVERRRSPRRARRRAAAARPRRRRRAPGRRAAAARRAGPPASRRPGRGRRRRSASAVAAPIAATRSACRAMRRRSSRAPFDARHDHPVVAGDVDGLVAERLDLDERAVDDLVAERLEPAGELLLLPARPRDDDPHEHEREQLARDRLGVGRRAPLDPGAVLVGDERGQRRAVVVRGDRSEAAAADERDAARARPRPAAASRRRPPPRRAPPRRRAPAARARPGPPPAAARAGSKRSPISRSSPSRSSPHAASTTASSPRSPRLRSRVSMLPRSGSIESDGSSASSCARRRTEAVPIRIPGRSALGAAERVARILARRVRADGEPLGVRRGHVLGGVDGDVDPAREQRLLELLDEDAARADLAERLRSVAVARRRDRDERDLDPGPRSRSAACSAWVSASLLPREPTRMSTASPRRRASTRRSPGRPSELGARPDAHERGRHLQRQRPARHESGRHPPLLLSPSPNRCLTTSA